MAKHRRSKNRPAFSSKRTVPKRRKAPSAIFLGTTAAAVSTMLVFGHATNNTVDIPQVDLAAATIGIGGRGDPGAVNVPHKLQGNVRPPTFSYIPIQYPAGFDIENSTNAGVPVLANAITNPANSGQFLMVVGYSEGTIVAEKVRRNLDPSDPGAPPLNPTNDPTKPGLLWVMIASPNVPNGGIFSRFPGLNIPFFVTSNGAAGPSEYNTTYVTNEYDPYGDFPAYFNPLSLANSLVAVMYVHPDQYYDSVNYDPLTNTTNDPNVLINPVTHMVNGHPVTDTYVFVRAEHLPLFAPVRQIAGILQLTPLTEPVLGAVEPLVRLLVDMGYTDRQNLNPETPVQFSLITPPGKVLETVAGVPGAIGQGVTNLVTGTEAIPGSVPSPLSTTNSPPSPLSTTNSPSITAKSLPQDSKQSLANSDPAPALTTQTTEQQEQSGSPTPPTTTKSNPGPTLSTVTGDGNKVTPDTTTAKTTTPKQNPLGQLVDSITKFFSPQKPATSTPGSESTDTKPTDSTSQGSTSNAA
ncbi:PE-PPE domain-containing protein [Mycobacterium sp. JS623]|uniref:PE-PPE domain-containing protein n=1 Tax=Mycobacterium sp. JS623 TaxID=212767 RepID=UPI0018E057B1|nr:PE-PPE domain-containing protein [Mycobacterium sp. JS623]